MFWTIFEFVIFVEEKSIKKRFVCFLYVWKYFDVRESNNNENWWWIFRKMLKMVKINGKKIEKRVS